jgi:ribosomal protein S18 acetylase RimI-like enzyme
VEARFTGPLQPRLAQAGWTDGEHWTPLVRSLAAPVPGHGLRIEVAGPDAMADRTAVQRAAFEGSRFSDDRWRTMAAGPAYREARCLVGYDADRRAVAAVTVWSAGRGRPGLLEPLGVHRDHRGRGHGRAITLAAAAALRELGSSSATVCTPSANTGAVAAYRSGGFEEQPQVADLHRQDQRPSGAAARR